MNKKKSCSYSRHKCTRIQYRSYPYCFQHILEDKSAPFISCQYISKITKRRCHNPALKNERSLPAFCEYHEVSENSSKLKARLISSEERQSFDEWNEFKSNRLQDSTGTQKRLLKLNELDAKSNSNWPVAASSSWKTTEADIDADSCDDNTDPLTNAGVFTLEEVANVSKERLIKLQSLYIKQFKQLHRQLQEKRRQFLLADSSAQSKPQKSSKQTDEKLQEFRSLVSYRKHTWKNQLLHRKSKRRRLQAMPKHLQPSVSDSLSSSKAKCSHVFNHVRCKSSCLPYTKYCISHIFDDPLQVLYKKCSKTSCNTPVCLLRHPTFHDELFCHLHHELPPMSNDLDALMEEIESDVTRFEKAEVSAFESGTIEIDETPEQSTHTRDERPAPITEPDEEAMQVCEDKEENTDMTLAPESELKRKNTESHQITKENSMDVDTTSSQKEPSLQDIAGSNPEPEKSVDQSRLSPAKMEEFKSGQCFLMNKITVFDQAEKQCMPAIHLEPVDTKAVEDELKNLAETTKPETLPDAIADEPVQSPLSDYSGVDSNTHNFSASVVHRGILMSVEKQDGNKDNRVSNSRQKVTTSVTLVPPVERISPEPSPVQNIASSNELLQKMPPLAPLRVSPTSLATDTDPLTVSSPFKATDDPSNTNQQAEEIHPTSAQVNVDDEQSAAFSQPLPADKESKEVTKNLEPEPQQEASLTSQTPPHDKDSEEEKEKSNGLSVGDNNSSSDRKPSSADEETAVASLLFLSSGTLHKH